MADKKILNLGCGRTNIEGMVNVDLDAPGHHPDVVFDLNNATFDQWMYAFPDMADGAQLIHVLEHIPNHLTMMENLWHVLVPGGLVHVRCPHGASDDAWEDPTHVRPFFPNSFAYYSQPTYWRADYGYRGDFRVIECLLLVDKFPTAAQLLAPADALDVNVTHGRNVVREMQVTLEAVKPAREPDRRLQEPIVAQIRTVGV